MTTSSKGRSGRKPPGDITLLLSTLQNDPTEIARKIFPIVYEELRQMANGKLLRERPDHTLQPTELVHETFYRLCEQGPEMYDDRIHFFGIASRAMNQILVNHARRRGAKKRAGAWAHTPLDESDFIAQSRPDHEALHEALDRLRAVKPKIYRIVVLCGLYGFSTTETAALLKMGEGTVRRDLGIARGWLRHALGGTPQ